MTGDIYRVIIRCTYNNNDVMLNTLHYEVGADVDNLATAADLALSVEQAFGDLYKAYMGLACKWEHVTAGKIYPLPPTAPAASAQEAGPGENDNGVVLPPQDAILIRKLTANVGRKYRGRIYLGGVVADWVDKGVLSLPYSPILDSIGAALIQTRVTPLATYRPCIYGVDKDQPPNVRGRVTYLTGFKVDPVLRCQRRRQIGRGD